MQGYLIYCQHQSRRFRRQILLELSLFIFLVSTEDIDLVARAVDICNVVRCPTTTTVPHTIPLHWLLVNTVAINWFKMYIFNIYENIVLSIFKRRISFFLFQDCMFQCQNFLFQIPSFLFQRFNFLFYCLLRLPGFGPPLSPPRFLTFLPWLWAVCSSGTFLIRYLNQCTLFSIAIHLRNEKFCDRVNK